MSSHRLSQFVKTYELNTFAGYTLASNRFAILEGFGCLPLFHLSSLSIAFIGGPDILIGTITFVVAGMCSNMSPL